MLTIVSTMKPMIDPFIIEQTNSILSWKHLKIKPDIYIFGNDEGVKEFCEKHNINHIPTITKNKENNGVPLINDILFQGYQLMKTKYIMYINADILLLDDFCDTLEVFDKTFPDVDSCLLTAMRINVGKFHLLDFNKYWRPEILANRSDVKCFGEFKYETPDGIDIFVHKKNNYKSIPDFAIARMGFDSWMLDYAIKKFDMSIDITNTCNIYHHMGKYYQEGKVCERGTDNVDPVDFKKNQTYLTDDIQMTKIDQCPFFTGYDENGEISFAQRYKKITIKTYDELFVRVF